MDYAQQQGNPSRHLVGIGGVILLHVLIIYALVSGLARKVVDVVKGPIEVKVIEEVSKPPPPPENLPPPPKLAAPPPPFIPPPEVNVAPPPAPTITAVTQEAPPAPTAPVITRTKAPPAPAAPPSAASLCPNHGETLASIQMPREAREQGLSGEVVVQFTIGADGRVRNPTILSSSNRIFNRTALNAALRLTCRRSAQDTLATLPLAFKLTD